MIRSASAKSKSRLVTQSLLAGMLACLVTPVLLFFLGGHANRVAGTLILAIGPGLNLIHSYFVRAQLRQSARPVERLRSFALAVGAKLNVHVEGVSVMSIGRTMPCMDGVIVGISTDVAELPEDQREFAVARAIAAKAVPIGPRLILSIAGVPAGLLLLVFGLADLTSTACFLCAALGVLAMATGGCSSIVTLADRDAEIDFLAASLAGDESLAIRFLDWLDEGRRFWASPLMWKRRRARRGGGLSPRP